MVWPSEWVTKVFLGQTSGPTKITCEFHQQQKFNSQLWNPDLPTTPIAPTPYARSPVSTLNPYHWHCLPSQKQTHLNAFCCFLMFWICVHPRPIRHVHPQPKTVHPQPNIGPCHRIFNWGYIFLVPIFYVLWCCVYLLKKKWKFPHTIQRILISTNIELKNALLCVHPQPWYFASYLIFPKSPEIFFLAK